MDALISLCLKANLFHQQVRRTVGQKQMLNLNLKLVSQNKSYGGSTEIVHLSKISNTAQ